MRIGDVVLVLEGQKSALSSCTGCVGIISDFLYYNSTPWVTFKAVSGVECKYAFSDNEVLVLGNIYDSKEKEIKPCTCSMEDLLKDGCHCGSIIRCVPKSLMS